MKDTMADGKTTKKKVLVKAIVRTVDDKEDVWTKETDPTFASATVLEGNILGILGDQGEPLRLYQPMFWLTCDGEYEDAE